MESTSDEQQGSMEPDGLYKPGRLTVDEPPDTHGRRTYSRFVPSRDDAQGAAAP